VNTQTNLGLRLLLDPMDPIKMGESFSGSARKEMARPERFELPTFWFVAVAARNISDLHGVLRTVTDCYRCLVPQGFRAMARYLITLCEVERRRI
jgi:hypothetical protein